MKENSNIDAGLALKIGIIQSSFMPWRGYFDFIASVDVFIFLDDVQYSKNSWRNRNKIKTSYGLQWLTVPVRNERLGQQIDETLIDNSQPWAARHTGSWKANYSKAPYFDEVMDLLAGLGDWQGGTISQLNIRLIRRICKYLDIYTPMRLSSELELSGSKTDRLIDLIKQLNGTTYLSGPSADSYLDKQAFRENGISLEYKSYDYPTYPQLWGAFEGGVTVLDLIANCGTDSMDYLRSQKPDTLVV